jgi:TM2 domain-containing membrane protein YozV
MAVSHEKQERTLQEEKVRRPGPEKNALIAIFLSFMLAGLGDLYAGSWIKAIVFFAVDIICYILIFAQGLGYLVYAPVWVCGLISAWLSVTSLERKTSSHGREALLL